MTSRRRRLVAALPLALAAALLLSPALPASAHSELVASSPGAGERLATPPAEVSLSFNENLLELGAAVLVVDATGRDWISGAPSVDGATLTVALDPALPTDAGYEVRWRVVSEDGHPISGVIPFTVGDGEPLADTAAGSSEDGDHAAEESAAPSAAGQSSEESGAVLRTVLLGVGGAALALAVFVLITVLRRRRSAADGAGRD